MKLRYYVARRLVFQAFVLFGLSIITFALTLWIPGDPLAALVGLTGRPLDAETRAFFERKWGLDAPPPQRYVIYMSNIFKGDLGVAILTERPVLEDLLLYFPATVELAAVSILVAIIIGIPLGVVSATRRNRATDHLSRIFSLFGVSMPIFWLGLIALLLFYYTLGWFPGGQRIDPYITPPTHITGMYILDSILTGNWVTLENSLYHILLPASVLGYSAVGIITRVTRSSMLDILSLDYIRACRAKGLSERTVVYRHALRNALIPTTTIIGVVFGQMLSGAVLTETIFAWPGLGRYAVTAIGYLDYWAIMGFVLLVGVLYSVINLIVDTTYALLNPRIRY